MSLPGVRLLQYFWFVASIVCHFSMPIRKWVCPIQSLLITKIHSLYVLLYYWLHQVRDPLAWQKPNPMGPVALGDTGWENAITWQKRNGTNWINACHIIFLSSTMGHSVSSGLISPKFMHTPSLIWLILLYLTYTLNQLSWITVGAHTDFGQIRPDDTEWPKNYSYTTWSKFNS